MKVAGEQMTSPGNSVFISPPVFNRRKKYAIKDSRELKRLKELEEENRKLKHMYAELAFLVL